MRLALTLEYNGAAYHGWQRQVDRGSVQQTLEQALAQIAGVPVAVVAAGRTDAGVHASCQVVHFDSPVARPLTAWVRGVNAHLPPSLAVLDAVPVADTFHARFAARARSYRYVLLNRPVRSALLAGRVGWYHAPLELESMRQAAQTLLGEHDFSAFRAAECQARSPIKHLQQLDVTRQGEVLIFDIKANAFLQHMVRNLVGTLLYVGNGRQPVDWAQQVLQQKSRALAAPTFMADGLYLCGVEYAPEYAVGGLRLPQLL